MEFVNKAEFVSKADALKQVKEKLQDRQYLIATYDEDNPFKDSYIVTLTDLSKSEQVQQKILGFDNVASITSRNTTINMLIKVANGIKLISGIILVLLVLISIFIIANTIKLTVHARRREISIMKYVGATNSFIRWPFIVEGIIIGVIAALLTILVLGLIYNAMMNNAEGSVVIQNMGVSLLGFSDMFTVIMLVYLGLGTGIGIIGSLISMRKYLKV